MIAIIFALIMTLLFGPAGGDLQPAKRGPVQTVEAAPATTTPPPYWPTAFKAFDCGWVEAELVARNVRPDVIVFMLVMAERESNCCPFIQGQDRTDSNCNVTHIAKGPPYHRSDTGLFMINGVHYRTEAGLVCPEYTCDQNVLRTDIAMQFDVMLTLYAKCGKKPWTAPNYGCSADWPYNN
jgi:hypothetical protein